MRAPAMLPFVAVVLGAMGCGQPLAPDVPVPVPITRFAAGAHAFTASSALAEREHLVVREAQAWAELWERMWQHRSPVPDRPDVDFTREMVVVVSLGARPTSGFDILIDSAAVTAEGLTVSVRAIAPDVGCAVLPVLTEPVDIARLGRSPRPVRFEQRTETRTCT